MASVTSPEPKATALGGTAAGSRQRALLLINSKAGGGGGIGEPRELLSAQGIEAIALETSADPRRLADITRLARECDRIVVCGGDGTLHKCAPALIAARLPFGIIPAGTANDLARTLGVPVDPVQAAGVIAAGKTQPIDLGEVNGKPYFNVASIGMSAELARSLTRDVKRRWGRAAYALTAGRVALAARPFRATITDAYGASSARTLQIAVGNGRYYGGGMAVEQTAAIDDGQLHLYSLEMASAFALLPMLWAFREGTHGRSAAVRTLVGDAFEVRTRRPLPVNADGELVTTTPASFRIRPAALTVFVP